MRNCQWRPKDSKFDHHQTKGCKVEALHSLSSRVKWNLECKIHTDNIEKVQAYGDKMQKILLVAVQVCIFGLKSVAAVVGALW